MDQETYDEHAAAIRAGRVVSYKGRTAMTMDELDFIASVTQGEDFPPPLEPYAAAPGVPNFVSASAPLTMPQGPAAGVDPNSITVTKEEFQAALSEQTKLMEADLAQAQDENKALRSQNAELTTKIQEVNVELTQVAGENLTLQALVTELQKQIDTAKTPASDTTVTDTSKPDKPAK